MTPTLWQRYTNEKSYFCRLQIDMLSGFLSGDAKAGGGEPQLQALAHSTTLLLFEAWRGLINEIAAGLKVPKRHYETLEQIRRELSHDFSEITFLLELASPLSQVLLSTFSVLLSKLFLTPLDGSALLLACR